MDHSSAINREPHKHAGQLPSCTPSEDPISGTQLAAVLQSADAASVPPPLERTALETLGDFIGRLDSRTVPRRLRWSPLQVIGESGSRDADSARYHSALLCSSSAVRRLTALPEFDISLATQAINRLKRILPERVARFQADFLK